MQEPYQWYVFYVKTNTENRVVDELGRYIAAHDFSPYEFDPFCPESEVYYRNAKGARPEKSYRRRPLFPGYIFMETTMPPKEFLTAFASYIYSSSDVIRLLKSGAGDMIALPKEERIRLEYFLKGRRCFEHSVGCIVGDKVIVKVGPLCGSEGLITYVNRHNRYADIEVEMFGGKIKARVALEIVEKTV